MSQKFVSDDADRRASWPPNNPGSQGFPGNNAGNNMGSNGSYASGQPGNYPPPPNNGQPNNGQPMPPNQPPNHQGRGSKWWHRRPALERDLDHGMVAGVAAGLARHLMVPSWLIRLAFIALTFIEFIGPVIYGLLWIVIPVAAEKPQAPGLEANERHNLRTTQKPQTRNRSMIFALALIGSGVLMLLGFLSVDFSSPVIWAGLVAVLGIALIWRQADEPETESDEYAPKALSWLVSKRGWAGTLRVMVGIGFLLVALGIATASRMGLSQLPLVLSVAIVVLIGLGVLVLPWAYAYSRKLNEARKAKVIADTRADMAAHLHDSVLQTLALIQRQADDPKTVAKLARSQERELRIWLYGEPKEAESLKAALQEVAGNIEDEWSVPVELVCVGDIELDDDLHAMVRAAREAITNAAKHSGADSVDVYAEVEPDGDDRVVSIFVRDRGVGFDLDKIADDRQGVKGSIQDRMNRHGGNVKIRTAPGEGTEVKLEMRV